MTDVLVVQARQFRHPVTLVVLVEPVDRAPHTTTMTGGRPGRYPAVAAWIALHTRCGVVGMSM